MTCDNCFSEFKTGDKVYSIDEGWVNKSDDIFFTVITVGKFTICSQCLSQMRGGDLNWT